MIVWGSDLMIEFFEVFLMGFWLLLNVWIVMEIVGLFII